MADITEMEVRIAVRRALYANMPVADWVPEERARLVGEGLLLLDGTPIWYVAPGGEVRATVVPKPGPPRSPAEVREAAARMREYDEARRAAAAAGPAPAAAAVPPQVPPAVPPPVQAPDPAAGVLAVDDGWLQVPGLPALSPDQRVLVLQAFAAKDKVVHRMQDGSQERWSGAPIGTCSPMSSVVACRMACFLRWVPGGRIKSEDSPDGEVHIAMDGTVPAGKIAQVLHVGIDAIWDAVANAYAACGTRMFQMGTAPDGTLMVYATFGHGAPPTERPPALRGEDRRRGPVLVPGADPRRAEAVARAWDQLGAPVTRFPCGVATQEDADAVVRAIHGELQAPVVHRMPVDPVQQRAWVGAEPGDLFPAARPRPGARRRSASGRAAREREQVPQEQEQAQGGAGVEQAAGRTPVPEGQPTAYGPAGAAGAGLGTIAE